MARIVDDFWSLSCCFSHTRGHNRNIGNFKSYLEKSQGTIGVLGSPVQDDLHGKVFVRQVGDPPRAILSQGIVLHAESKGDAIPLH